MRDFLKDNLPVWFLLVFSLNIGVTLLAGFIDILKRNRKRTGAWQFKNTCLEAHRAIFDQELGLLTKLFLLLFFGQFGIIIVTAFTYHEWKKS